MLPWKDTAIDRRNETLCANSQNKSLEETYMINISLLLCFIK